MKMTRLELLHLLSAELVPTLSAVLQGREHKISDADEAEMLKATNETIKNFLGDVEKYVKKD